MRKSKTQKKLKKDDIVRRVLKGSKFPIGSLKVVDDVDEFGGVYAHDIPTNALGSMFYKQEDLVVVKSVTLRIQNDEIKHVMSDNINWVQHVTNKSWLNALEAYLTSNVKNPIVAVTLVSNTSHIIVTEPVFCRIYDRGVEYIKLKFVRILESVIR